MLLTFLLAAALWNCNCWWNAANIYAFAVQPGYLDFDNLPDTNFSCDGKVIGGYYADVETGCQMFHVCTIGQKAEITDIKFLCLNGTVFDQETRVCERLDEVDCSKSESFFDLNLELYGNNGAGYGIQPEEPPEQEPAPCNVADEEDCSGTSDYVDEEVTTVALPPPPPPPPPTTASTTTTTTTTTTRTTTAAAVRTTSGATRTSAGPTGTTAKPHQQQQQQQPAVSYPTNSPETIAALIALHNAFQESLKEREQGPGPKGQQSHRYRPSQQQPLPRPFTATDLEPPRRFPSKAPPYRHPEPVLLSSERFGNQNFRHGFRLENGPPPSPPSPSPSPPPPPPPPPSPSSYQQQSYDGDDGPQYDGAIYDEDDDDGGGTAGRRETDEDESRRNFAREAHEASVSVSVRVSSSSSKDSAVDRQQQQRRRPPAVIAATTATAKTPPSPAPSPSLPAHADDADDLYEDEYEDDRPDGEEDEFFRDVPKLRGRNRRRRHVVGGGRRGGP